MYQNKDQQKNAAEHTRRDIEEFVYFEKMNSRSRVLFEADVDEVLRTMGVQGDSLDYSQYKDAIRVLANLKWIERRSVDSAEKTRYSSVDMNRQEASPANLETPRPKISNGMYLDARRIADYSGMSLSQIRRLFTQRKTESNPNGLRVYERGRRLFTTEKDFDEFMRSGASDA